MGTGVGWGTGRERKPGRKFLSLGSEEYGGGGPPRVGVPRRRGGAGRSGWSRAAGQRRRVPARTELGGCTSLAVPTRRRAPGAAAAAAAPPPPPAAP